MTLSKKENTMNTMNTTKPNETNSIKRDWHSLKPGDVIWLANGWFKVFDAYLIGQGILKLKIIVDDHVEAYNFRTACSQATCQA